MYVQIIDKSKIPEKNYEYVNFKTYSYRFVNKSQVAYLTLVRDFVKEDSLENEMVELSLVPQLGINLFEDDGTLLRSFIGEFGSFSVEDRQFSQNRILEEKAVFHIFL